MPGKLLDKYDKEAKYAALGIGTVSTGGVLHCIRKLKDCQNKLSAYEAEREKYEDELRAHENAADARINLVEVYKARVDKLDRQYNKYLELVAQRDIVINRKSTVIGGLENKITEYDQELRKYKYFTIDELMGMIDVITEYNTFRDNLVKYTEEKLQNLTTDDVKKQEINSIIQEAKFVDKPTNDTRLSVLIPRYEEVLQMSGKLEELISKYDEIYRDFVR